MHPPQISACPFFEGALLERLFLRDRPGGSCVGGVVVVRHRRTFEKRESVEHLIGGEDVAFLLRAFCTRTPLSTSVCMALRAASRLRPVSRAADCMLTTGVPGSTSNKRSAADPLRGRTRFTQNARRHSMRSSKDRASPQASTTALQKYRMNASCAERSSSSSAQCKFSRASIYAPRFEAMDIDMGGRVRSMRPPDRRTSSVRALPVRPFPSANGWIDSNCA